MKMLYLLYKSCSRHFKSEILIMIQVFVAIVLLNTSIIPFVKFGQIHYWIADKMPDEMVYYSIPTFAPLDSGDTYDYFSVLYSDNRIKSICLTYHTVGYINGEKADIYLYSPEVFNYLNSPLASGSWDYKNNAIYINQGVVSKFGEIDEYEVTVNDSLFNFQGRYSTVGIINKNDIVFDITQAGDHPEYSEVGIDYSGLRHLIPTRTKLLAIVPFDIRANHPTYDMIGGAIIELQDSSESTDFVREYNASLRSGKMFLKMDLEANSIRRLVGTYKYDALISILVSISTLLGVGGYTYLRLDDLKKQMGIYIFCGCPFKLYSTIIIMLNIILLTVPAVVAYYTRNILVLSEGYDSIGSFAIAFVFVLGVSLIPITITLFSSKKSSLMQLIYHGD